MKFIVDLSLDGYVTEEEMQEACIEFIRESLDFSASSVSVEIFNDELLRKSLKLDALESAGVDNWQGYSDAMEYYREFLKENKLEDK